MHKLLHLSVHSYYTVLRVSRIATNLAHHAQLRHLFQKSIIINSFLVDLRVKLERKYNIKQIKYHILITLLVLFVKCIIESMIRN